VPPSPADLAAAANRTIPDVLPPPGAPLRVLFCGINPSLYSAATGWHFARPGNRFWPALHLSGFTPRRLAPAEQDLLAGYGLGITNLVARATIGPQPDALGGARLWVLPNPSGLNASWTLPRIAEAFRELRESQVR